MHLSCPRETKQFQSDFHSKGPSFPAGFQRTTIFTALHSHHGGEGEWKKPSESALVSFGAKKLDGKGMDEKKKKKKERER